MLTSKLTSLLQGRDILAPVRQDYAPDKRTFCAFCLGIHNCWVTVKWWKVLDVPQWEGKPKKDEGKRVDKEEHESKERRDGKRQKEKEIEEPRVANAY
jgi:hypothetical protein